jgi:hypothetical protein
MENEKDEKDLQSVPRNHGRSDGVGCRVWDRGRSDVSFACGSCRFAVRELPETYGNCHLALRRCSFTTFGYVVTRGYDVEMPVHLRIFPELLCSHVCT